MKKMLFCIELLLLMLVFTSINVNASENRGVINVDTPNTITYYGDSLTVSGWALSTSKNSALEIYFDNTPIVSTYRWYREDVLKVIKDYGTEVENPEPGYTANIDLSNESKGDHQISIIMKDENQEIIAKKELKINIDANSNLSSIDAPNVNVEGTSLTIGGWALSSNSNAILNLYVNNEKIDPNSIKRFRRDDVLNVFKGYANNSFNTNCGYNAYYDASNLADGSYPIKLEITDGNNILYTQTKEITLKKYKAQITIEAPGDNKYVSGTTLIGGWALTDCPNQTLIVKMDGTPITNQIKRFKRDDVLRIIKGYGNEVTNAMPGYNLQYDVSNLTYGSHQVSVTLVNGITNEEITTVSKNIRIKAPVTYLAVESISNKQIVKGAQVYIGGWLMSQVENATLEVYMDNNLLPTNISRFDRPDVLKAIRDCGNSNTQPGFSTYVDVSGYRDGMHTLKFIVKDPIKNQELYKEEKTIRLEKYSGISSIDAPSTNIKGTSLNIGGWVLSNDASAKLKIYLDDGIDLTDKITRWNRTDVFNVIDKQYGTQSQNPNAGYNIKYDATNLPDGKHTITLQMINQTTGEIIHENKKKFSLKKYQVTGTLDTVLENKTYIGTKIQIGGWIMSTNPNISIETNVDGVASTGVTRGQRDDVIKVISGYGGKTTNPTPGYNSFVDVSGLADGWHNANLVVKDNITGDIMYQISRRFIIKKYDGEVTIDAPATSMFNNKTANSILVGGWALCQQEDSYLKVYIDGKDINATINRYERSDLAAVSYYGSPEKNKLAGYNTIINIGNLGEGSHNLTLRLYNKQNELVKEKSKKIQIYHNMYPGIDVSKFQENIDWNLVSHGGINFAMIRLGYRGYLPEGRLAEDDKFVQNVKGAYQNGVKIGLYFFSQAKNYQEGVDEANYVIDKLNEYGFRDKITFPIAFDTEKSTGYPNGRADHLSRNDRTQAALGFARTIANNGYTPMIYASKYWFYDNLDMLQLNGFHVWLAHYTSGTGTLGNFSDYNGTYQIWQYTSSGRVSGISGDVDMNLAFRMY